MDYNQNMKRTNEIEKTKFLIKIIKVLNFNLKKNLPLSSFFYTDVTFYKVLSKKIVLKNSRPKMLQTQQTV